MSHTLLYMLPDATNVSDELATVDWSRVCKAVRSISRRLSKWASYPTVGGSQVQVMITRANDMGMPM